MGFKFVQTVHKYKGNFLGKGKGRGKKQAKRGHFELVHNKSLIV